MSGNSRVWHERGFSVKFSQALKSIRNGWLTWTDDTHTMVRDCTPAEQWEIQSQLAAERVRQSEVFGSGEIGGCRFVAPSTTAYQQPWTALEEMCAPMMTRVCRWPYGAAGRVRATRIRRRRREVVA